MDLKSNDSKVKLILGYILQLGMASCIAYIAYKLVYRPLTLGVDILPYTMVDVSFTYVIYSMLNALYKYVACYTHGFFIEEEGMHLTLTSSLIIVLNLALLILYGDSMVAGLTLFIFLTLLVSLLHIRLIYLAHVKSMTCKSR